MIQRIFAIATLLTVAYTATAQLRVDGRPAMLDAHSDTLLATVSATAYATDTPLRLSQADGWTLLAVEGRPCGPDTLCTFPALKGHQAFRLTMVSPEGDTKTLTLQFTSLPLMRLEGSFGQAYSRGRFTLCQADSTSAQTLDVKVKWRGRWSDTVTTPPDLHKRNYRLEFDGDQRFFNLRSDDDWKLDAGIMDLFRVRNIVAARLWSDMAARPHYADEKPNARSTTRGEVVELFLNDRYQGIYTLLEPIDRKQMKLAKADTVAGIIKGALWKATGYGHATMWSVDDLCDDSEEVWDNFEAKYPEVKDLGHTTWEPLHSAISFVVNSSDEDFRAEVTQRFDLPVVRDFFLFTTALQAIDNVGKNIYWAVHDQRLDQRLTPALWDMDVSMGLRTAERWNPDYSSPELDMGPGINLIYRLLKTNAAGFADSCVARYRQLRLGLLSTDSLQARYRQMAQQLIDAGADLRDEQRWQGDSELFCGYPLDISAEVDYICQWIERRMDYLDRNDFPDFFHTSGLSAIAAPRGIPQDGAFYNLQGQRIDRPTRAGVYLRGGKKVVFRK